MAQATSQVIKSVEVLRQLFADYCKGFGNHPASQVRRVRFDELESEEIATLNDWLDNHAIDIVVDPNIPGILEELMGLRECQAGEAPFTTIGGKSFYSQRNKNNRRKTDSRIKPITTLDTYSNLMSRGKWISNRVDRMVYDEAGECLSGQHRGDAMVTARNAGYTLPMLYVTLAFPWQFKDTLDKAKARSKNDDNTTDPNCVPMPLIQLVQLHLSGEHTDNAKGEANAERSNIIAVRSKIAEMLYARLNGKDIPPTGGKVPYSVESAILHRLGYTVIPGFKASNDAGETIIDIPDMECSKLDLLACKVWEASKGAKKSKKAWAQYLFAPTIVGTCLVLSDNGEEALNAQLANVQREPGETVEDFADRVNAMRANLIAEAPLALDLDEADRILGLLSSSSLELDSAGKVTSNGGPLGELFANLYTDAAKFKANNEDKKYLYKPLSIAAMSACVQLVQNLKQAEPDYTSSVFTKYKKVEGEYPVTYRCFGGVDVGYTSETKAKGKGKKG